ncbi:unnamed protein product [Schistosoma spindalis]|nr:unnamed protein product [Schistosoma spindale]
MNLTNFQYDLLNQFKFLGQILAPFEDGGILNYLFEQITINSSISNSSIGNSIDNSSLLRNNITSINDNQSITLLKFIEINDTFTFFRTTLNHMLFDGIQNINVYNVLLMNQNDMNTTVIDSNKLFVTRKFIVLIIIEILLIFISFLLSMCYFIFLYPPNCIHGKSSWNYLKYLKITQVLRDIKYKNDMNHSNMIDIRSDSLSNKYIEDDEMSRYTTEWMLRNEANVSVNSSDIYINDPIYNRQSSKKSSTNSIISSTLTNHNEIQQPTQYQCNSLMMNSLQFHTQLKVYFIIKIIVYSLICINIFLSIICFYAMDSSYIHLQPKFIDNTTNQTVKTLRNLLMNEVVYKLPEYLQEIITQGQMYTNQTFRIIEKELDSQLLITTEKIIQSLLETYQLSPVIKSAESISYSINETVTASRIINVQQKTLQQDVNSYIGELRGYANILNKTLDSICEKLNENTIEKVTCRQLQLNNSILLINVDTKLFEFESSSIMVFLMNDLNISLNSITDQFNIIQNLLNIKKDEVIQSMKSTFNLDYYLNIFTSIWILLQQNIVDKLNSYLTINKQQEIDNYLQLISYIVSIIGYVIITFILILITLLLIYCILYIVDIYNRNLFTKQNDIKYDSSKLFTLQIQGEFHKKLFLLQLNRSIYLPHIINHKHIKYLIILSLIISIFCSIILSILYIILPLLLLFDTELCRYINTDSGILITDFIIDLYIQYQWSYSMLHNFTLLSNDLLNYINLLPPKHIYSTIRNKCQPMMYNNNNNDLNTTTTTAHTTNNTTTTNTTNNTTINTTNSNNNDDQTYRNYNLLKLLNYSQIINFDKILYSSIIQEKIKDAEISTINKIINMDLAKFIPSDLDSLTSIARKLSVYLDGKDYKPTIQEIIHFISIKSKLLNYLNEIKKFIQFNRNISNLIDIIDQINNSLIMYDKITNSINPLINLFEKLEINKNLTQRLDQILNGLNNFKNISSNPQRLNESIQFIFNSSIQFLLNQLSKLLNNQFEQLFNNIIPCNNINKILMIILNIFCNRTNNIILCLGSFILIISISYFLLIITLFIFMIYSIKHIDLLIYTKWENITLYDSVKLCYKFVKSN